MEQLTERQLSAVKRIYDRCVWFLHEYDRTEGFMDYWNGFINKGIKDPEPLFIKVVNNMLERVRLVLQQEYFDLRGTEIYAELKAFVVISLTDVYDRKLNLEYCEKTGGYINLSTLDNYEKAVTKLNHIIETYVPMCGGCDEV